MTSVCYFIQERGSLDQDSMRLSREGIDSLFLQRQKDRPDATRRIVQRTVTETIVSEPDDTPVVANW